MKLLPRSGSEPKNYEYYTSPRAEGRNNCMAFAFGERGREDGVKQQPGNKSGLRGVDFSLANCKALVDRVKRDYKGKVYVGTPTTPCRPGFTKVMAFLARNQDFHFYRQEPSGYWAHKRGLTPVSRVDACNKPIKHPTRSCRKFGDGYDYKTACATFCRAAKGPKARPKRLSATHTGSRKNRLQKNRLQKNRIDEHATKKRTTVGRGIPVSSKGGGTAPRRPRRANKATRATRM